MTSPVKRAAMLGLAVALVAAVLGWSVPSHVRLSAGVGVSVVGNSVPVVVTGLGHGQPVVATMSSRDADGVSWRSRTAVIADARGQAVLDAVTLISAMTPVRETGAYWRWGDSPRRFQLSVAGASVSLVRRLTRLPVTETRLSTAGFQGYYYSDGQPARRSAVLYLGGSEGGFSGGTAAEVLAGEGHRVLALAYFGVKSLPPTLCDIPLEYFANALRWLARQPGVDPHHLVVDGVSRGGEVALLLGATYPALVHGVIAGVPSNTVRGGCGGAGPAWTLGGKPVPYTRQEAQPHPTDNLHAYIPVERIDGPILMTCGFLDNVWPSCEYADAVMARLHQSRYPHQLLRCRWCDHFVGRGVPGQPGMALDAGGQYAQDKLAFVQELKATLALLS